MKKVKITEEYILKKKQEHEDFLKEFKHVNEKFEEDHQKEKLEDSLYELTKRYKENYAVCLEVVDYGEKLMDLGKKELGIRYLQIAQEALGEYVDDITFFLRSAEYYIDKGEVELGTAYLIKLCCETTSNYEESIEFRQLTHVWEKYKYLVEGKVPASVNVNEKTRPLTPDECTMQIADILQLPEDSLLLELSTHLYELSGAGESLNYLNRWERGVFYLDLLCTDINSDGIEHFTEYHGKHWKQTKKAMEGLNIEKGVLLMDQIHNKMKKHVEDFEDEEAFYYEFVEKELLEKLYQYVIENKERFR